MRRLGLALVALGLLVGCATEKPEKLQVLTPGTRLIYYGRFGVFTACDRGNRLYMTETGLLAVVEHGCPDGNP